MLLGHDIPSHYSSVIGEHIGFTLYS